MFARIGPIWRGLLTAPPVLFLYFALLAGLFLYFEYVESTVDLPEGMRLGEYLGTKFITGKEQEPMELLLGSAFLLSLFTPRSVREITPGTLKLHIITMRERMSKRVDHAA